MLAARIITTAMVEPKAQSSVLWTMCLLLFRLFIAVLLPASGVTEEKMALLSEPQVNTAVNQDLTLVKSG